jgi:beta-galactosidase
MNRINRVVVFLLLTLTTGPISTYANKHSVDDIIDTGRQVVSMNQGWGFYYSDDIRIKPRKIEVTLPHTWNASEVMSGKSGYKRQTGIYTKTFTVKKAWSGKRKFLFFEGANSVADVYINQNYVGSHKGGYTAFCLEITDFLKDNSDNLITVMVSNAYRTDVLPLVGDFNVYGGIHRPMSLIIANKNCISPLDYASSGVYLTQTSLTEQLAKVTIATKLSIKELNKNLSVRTRLLDRDKKVIAEIKTAINSVNSKVVVQKLAITRPVLWNGRAAAYLYEVQVELLDQGQIVDAMNQPLGLRNYNVDPGKGFFLNGKHMDIHGLGRHEDVAGKGSALVPADEEKDIALIKEIGANAMRLTHYPHSRYFLDLCDQNGIIIWSEIPMVGPGGYTGPGFINSPELKAHAGTLLKEMIRQNYNHPSILFWGLFNELKLDFDDPLPFIKAQHALAKKEDPGRLTVLATFLDNDYFNSAADLIAWNKYYGWYGGKFEDIGKWADDAHAKYPAKAIAVSEFGAGGSIKQQEDHPLKPKADGKWHPEKWQTLFHESNWAELSTRPFIWAKFAWALADFGSSIRSEGDTTGMNDKGLVTYDRKIKKDAFYFYKANWNPEPMLYLADRRNIVRTDSLTDIKVYTNTGYAELYLNGLSVGEAKADQFKRVIWKNVKLKQGQNKIAVKTHGLKIELWDEMTLTL